MGGPCSQLYIASLSVTTHDMGHCMAAVMVFDSVETHKNVRAVGKCFADMRRSTRRLPGRDCDE